MNPAPLWRVFPWDPNAAEGERFSASFVPGGQGRNRFDLRGHAGLRWWSAFWGEWHTTVLFRDRIPADAITYGVPLPLGIAMPPVVEAARLLDIG